jgi:hypothetical protein
MLFKFKNRSRKSIYISTYRNTIPHSFNISKQSIIWVNHVLYNLCPINWYLDLFQQFVITKYDAMNSFEYVELV